LLSLTALNITDPSIRSPVVHFEADPIRVRKWDALPGPRENGGDLRAEDAGFEPARVLPQHAFQACAIGH
jgi:hypothetical protein